MTPPFPARPRLVPVRLRLAPARLAAALLLLTAPALAAPDAAAPTPPPPAPAPAAPAGLPGRGLAQHDFFYAGEAQDRRAFIVRHGQVVWAYADPAGKGEISDATLLSDGDVLLAHQFAVDLLAPDKTVRWHYDAPPGAEIHTAVPIGRTHVLFIQNGDPALVKVVDITTGRTVRQFPLAVGSPGSVHGQFRHARLTEAGTLMVAHMDLGKVSEYDGAGKELWTLPAPGVWGVTPLPGGHLLLAGGFGVREVDRQGRAVWAVSGADLPGYTLHNWQQAWRLPDGDTLFNFWANQWNGAIDPATAPVQALEVTPGKRVVWALRAWAAPDLGPATTIQILDTPAAPEDVHFGDIR